MTRQAQLATLHESYAHLSRAIANWDALGDGQRRTVTRLLGQYRRCARDLGVIPCGGCGPTGLGIAPVIVGAAALAGGAGWLGWRLRALLAGSQDAAAFTDCVRAALAGGAAATVEEARGLCDRRTASPLFWLGLGGGIVGAATLLAPHIRELRGR